MRKAQSRMNFILELLCFFVRVQTLRKRWKQNGVFAPPKKDSPPAPVPVLSPVCTRKSGITLKEYSKWAKKNIRLKRSEHALVRNTVPVEDHAVIIALIL
jgi:hypothetical protein